MDLKIEKEFIVNEIYKELENIKRPSPNISNENKVNDIRKLFERLFKYMLNDIDLSYPNLHLMIKEYIKKSNNQGLERVLFRLKDDLNKWSHDTIEKLEDNEFSHILVLSQRIIEQITEIKYPFENKITKEFDLDILDLNNEQKNAVLSKSNFTLVKAGPGTGKTHLIVGRVLNELNNNPNKKIFAISFTNKAAESLQHKIEPYIWRTDLFHNRDNIFTATFHSFALMLIKEYFNLNNREFDYEILDENDLKELKAEFNNDIKKLNDYLEENKIWTFDKIIEVFSSSIEHNENFQNFLNNQMNEIVIDEAQDLDTEQYNILSLLYRNIENLKLFFVGDQRQNIYAFKGGSLINIDKFFDNVEKNIIELKFNYRNTQNILDFVNKFNFKDTENIKLYSANNKKGKPIKLYELYNQEEEGDFIAKLISDKIKEGMNYNKISILYSNTFYFKEILKSLNNFKIPFKVFGGQWIMNLHIKHFRYILGYINSKNSYSLGMIKIFWLNSDESKNSISDLDTLISIMSAGGEKTKNLKLTLEFIKNQILKNNKEVEIILYDYIKFIKEKKLLEKFQDDFEKLLKIIQEDSNLNDYDSFRFAFSPTHPKLNIFFQKTDEIVESEYYDNDDKFVTISTIHGAKGLEWDEVIIPGMSQDSFPRYYKEISTQQKEMPNEWKKFYVACTRAIENLYFTRAKKISIKSKKDGNIYIFDKDKSIFLNLLDEKIDSYKNTNDDENSYFNIKF